jgi:hypothetical protein
MAASTPTVSGRGDRLACQVVQHAVLKFLRRRG